MTSLPLMSAGRCKRPLSRMLIALGWPRWLAQLLGTRPMVLGEISFALYLFHQIESA